MADHFHRGKSFAKVIPSTRFEGQSQEGYASGFAFAHEANPRQGNRCGLGRYRNPGGQSEDELIVFATVE